jgi:hypothetical protein
MIYFQLFIPANFPVFIPIEIIGYHIDTLIFQTGHAGMTEDAVERSHEDLKYIKTMCLLQ